ncbi:amidase family protein [Neptuniibacter halophilus]|uniref:amidase family protein n=1 Tax=Neptuniibacter halophilus TaxID=651666 RepID=UPI002572A1F3|nr:amidase family protein [Neptuniibacter halophilus]
MSRPLWQWSACDLASAIRTRELSCEEAVTATLERMQQTNPRINAVVVEQSEPALQRARQLDNQLAREPEQATGALFGVPATIKVNIDQEGYATDNGVAAYKNLIAGSDAPVTRHLNEAGAVLIGRTNAPEFSIRWQTDNPLHGLTLNPWDENITCGGSSGGAAAATLMGYGPIAHGNDIGGSLRCPSYCCGTTTVRPTLGRVPAYNPTGSEERPFLSQLMSVQGIIAREVKDVRLATEVISQRDVRDPNWVPAPFFGPQEKGPVRVALCRESYGLPIHPEVLKALDLAAKALQDAGYIIEEVEAPRVEETNKIWRDLLFTDFRQLSPGSIDRYGSDTLKQIMQGYYSVSEHLDRDCMLAAMAARNSILRDWNLFQEQYALVLTPLILQPPYPRGEDEKSPARAAETLLSYLYMANMNMLGLPAATISTHLFQGVPVGVQIIGRRYREDQCLDAAEVVETAQGVMAHRLWQRDQG